MDPDLFGQIAVTLQDVETWLVIVARLAPDSPRRAHYAQAWHVEDKIRTAKATGHWPPESPF